tara:strand:+ start:535 stop:1995 length:1461 start_codon:yes stop_codon:yes gene_type:complete
MGIDNVSIKTFDSTGSQSVCRANEYSGSEHIRSSLLSKCKKMYISGTGETFIPGNLKTFPDSSSSDTFSINTETCGLSELSFCVEFRFKAPSDPRDFDVFVSNDIILALIHKVEIYFGHITIQTLTSDDIYIRNLTELGKSSNLSGPNFHLEDKLDNIYHRKCKSGDVVYIQASCSIPFIGRSLEMNNALLRQGALTNNIKIKVSYNNLNPSFAQTSVQILSGSEGTVNYLDSSYFKSFIKPVNHSITEIEKQYISGNLITHLVHTSHFVQQHINKVTNVVNVSGDLLEVVISLDEISLNVSHILFALRLPHVNNRTISKSSSTSSNLGYHSDLPVYSTNGFSDITEIKNHTTSSIVYDTFGYFSDFIDSAELIIGSDRTGFIKSSMLLMDNNENFGLKYVKSNDFYILKVAEKAFDTSGIDFSKIHNKKLSLKIKKDIFLTDDPTDNHPIENTLNSNNVTQNAYISVTVCGTQVQSVVGGSVAFS